ncbi:MoaD/ThiS family protein [Salinispira pacifica]
MNGTTKQITLEYYARFREVRGCNSETIVTDAPSPRELFDEIDRRYRFGTDRGTVRVAVNDEIAAWDRTLADGDTVVFLTPFGGG